jgi:DNA-binding IclR family transcriptional regulator
MLNLHGSVLRNMHLGIQAMPVMKAIMARVEETVHLAVLHQGEVLYIDRVEGLHTPPSMYTHIGKRVPAHCTALGKAMLAHQPGEIVAEILARRGMRQMTAKTVTTPGALEQELERTRQRGYAIDDEEIEDGIRCIAAPIRDYTDGVCAAVSISGPKPRVRTDREAELSKSVIWAASLISTKLGYLGSEQ